MGLRRPYLIALVSLAALLVIVLVSGMFGSVPPTQAGLVIGGDDSQPLIGPDDDNLGNPALQPPNTDINQTLNNTDILQGGPENNVIIGLQGDDVILGGPESDITIGGTEQGQGPNSDIILGGEGDDVNIWAPGDGSDAYIGGSDLDAMVFGVIDRGENNVPILDGTASGFSYGIPTADVTGQGGFAPWKALTTPSWRATSS